MLRYLGEVGLLNERLTIAHGVWLRDEEVGMLAAAGAGLAHNPISNLKLKSGIAPMRRVIDAGVNVALGCDNCSCGDCQSMFGAMKLLCLLAAASEPRTRRACTPPPPCAPRRWAAPGRWGLQGEVGAIRAGMLADLLLLDTSGRRLPAIQQRGAAGRVCRGRAGGA